MKKYDFLNKVEDKGRFIVPAISTYFICLVTSLIIGLIYTILGIDLMGQFVSSIVLLVLFMASSKIFFNVNYKGLRGEIKSSKYDCLDKLLVTIFFSLIVALIYTLIYQIDSIINPNKTKLISYFLENINNNDTTYTNNSLDVLISIITLIIAVAAEEIFFRYSLYRIFVKKNEDIIVFITLSSIIFGLYHFNSIPRFLTSTIFGLCLSIIYLMTKSLVYTFISHFLWNCSVSIAGCYIYMFKSMNISLNTFRSAFAGIIILLILTLLSIYSYYKRGHIIPLKIKNKIYNISDGMNIH